MPVSLRWPGQHVDSTGYFDNGFRTYLPVTVGGRYLEGDPLGLAGSVIGSGGGTNIFPYAGNNPFRNTDPTGQIALWDNLLGAGIGGGVDFLAQAAQAKLAGQPLQLDWKRTGVATGAGFLTSGASALLSEGVAGLEVGSAASFALRAAGNAAIGAGAGATSTAILNKLECTNDNVNGAALFGGLFGAGGSVVGDLYTSIGPALGRAQYSSLSAGLKNWTDNYANLNGITLFAPSPAFVTGGAIAGNAVGSASSFFGTPTNASFHH